MPQRPGTPRVTRNSRGFRDTTPTAPRASRESSIASDDGVQAPPTPLRRSARQSRASSVASDDGSNPPRAPTTRARLSRQSSVVSDNGNRGAPTPKPRPRRSRSKSVEPTTDAAAPPDSHQPTPPTSLPQAQLLLAPVSESVSATPAVRPLEQLQHSQPGHRLTPIKEEGPTPTPSLLSTLLTSPLSVLRNTTASFPNSPLLRGLQSTLEAADIPSPVRQQTSPQTSTQAQAQPEAVDSTTTNPDEPIDEPAPTNLSPAAQSDPTPVQSTSSAPVTSPTLAILTPAVVTPPVVTPAVSTPAVSSPAASSPAAPLASLPSSSLHRVGPFFSLQPVTPPHFYFGITDDELQTLIRKDCDDSEIDDLDETDRHWAACRRERAKARRQYKLKWRRDQLRRAFKLPEDFSEKTHPEIIGEDPEKFTDTYTSLKVQDGHAFGARLLRAIKDDHDQRCCECPLPQVYPNRAQAEAGQGTFRFFRDRERDGNGAKIWVFMRKDDWHWHCLCSNPALSDFSLWVRKRKAGQAADALAQAQCTEQLLSEEQEEIARRLARKRKAEDEGTGLADSVVTRLIDGTRLRGASAATQRRIARLKSTRLAQSVKTAGSNITVQSMGGFLSTAATIMGTSVRHFLSRVGTQISTVWRRPTPTQTALETRTQDENGNLVVKRLKYQHYAPVTQPKEGEAQQVPSASAAQSPFDELAFFEWTSNPRDYVGEEYLNVFSEVARAVSSDIETGRFDWGESEEALKAKHADTIVKIEAGLMGREQYFNLELSLRLHRLALEMFQVDDVKNPTSAEDNEDQDAPDDVKGKYTMPPPKGHKREVLAVYGRTAAAVPSAIEMFYLERDMMKNLRDLYGPKPPKDLSFAIDSNAADTARLARNFMVRFLKEERTLDDRMRICVSRFIADMDSIHKKDIYCSLVEFPGKWHEAEVQPGTWPPNVVEDVPIDELYIKPLHEVRKPEKEPEPEPESAGEDDGDSKDAASGAESDDEDAPSPLLLLPSRGIYKDPRFHTPMKTPPAGRSPVGPRLRFADDLVSFGSPKFKPQRLVRKKKPAGVPKATQRLWQKYLEDVFAGGFSPRRFSWKVPMGNPEDQPMKGAAGCKNPITGEYYPSIPGKYERFLKKTRNEIFEGGWPVAPTKWSASWPPPRQVGTPAHMGTSPAQKQESQHDGMVDKSAQPKTPQRAMADSPYRPIRAAQMTPTTPNPWFRKSPEQVKAERDVDIVDRSQDLFSDVDLDMSTKKLEDLHIARQVREEQEAAAERARVELARRKEEEKRRREAEERRKAEEESRRREEEERRAAEEERRRREQVAARRREEDRLLAEERRRMALGLRRPHRAIITRLNESWGSRVAHIRGTAEGQPLATTPDGTPLTKRDFLQKLLPPTAWLNDNIIIGAIQHVGDLVNAKRGGTKENPKCAAFTSYFYPRLESAGPNSCARLMRRAGVRKDNFRDIESILIPICSGSHWTLAVVLPQKGAVLHMDSLRGGRGNPAVAAKVMEWVKATLAEGFKPADWSVVHIDGPTQTNGYDCGVFTITNGLCMALGLNPKDSYAASQLTTARTMLAAILLNGGFKGDFDLDGI